jgi:hypothetical protein
MLIEVFIAAKSHDDQAKILEAFAEFAPKPYRFGVRLDGESSYFLLSQRSARQLHDECP